MRSQITGGTKTSGRNMWSVFPTRWKDPVTIGVGILTLLIMIGTAFIKGASWVVDNRVEALRGELAGEIKTTNAKLSALRNQIGTSNAGTESRTTTLDGDIGENNRRISDNGERIARMESALTGTTDRLNRLHIQVTKNTEAILKAGGTPDVKVGGTPDWK